jgi:hypothetical protein
MNTGNQSSKPEESPEQVTGEGCPEAFCSAGLLFDDGTIMRVVKSGKRAEAWMCEAAENPREMYEYSTSFILRHAIGFVNVSCSQCGRDFGPGGHGYSHCSDHSPKGQCGDCKFAMELDRYDQVHCCCDESPQAWSDVEATDSCFSFLPNTKIEDA